ncbi:MAG TPA: hypothetical protein ENJ55_07285, partial [Rhizobiales bacterium]|nr:hypothetical protein [Hyphomicrobiales bacterium]
MVVSTLGGKPLILLTFRSDSMSDIGRTEISGIASSKDRIRHVFIRDLQLRAMLGVYDSEKLEPQRVIVNVDLSVKERGEPLD